MLPVGRRSVPRSGRGSCTTAKHFRTTSSPISLLPNRRPSSAPGPSLTSAATSVAAATAATNTYSIILLSAAVPVDISAAVPVALSAAVRVTSLALSTACARNWLCREVWQLHQRW